VIFELLVIGKTEENWLQDGVKQYVKRLSHYINFNEVIIPSIKNAKNLPESVQKQKEGEIILNYCKTSDWVVLLDENGKSFTSRAYSAFIQTILNGGNKRVVFIIGGPFGFSEEVYKRANAKISLSEMTFSHQMIRLFFVEQLYRAFTIIKGEKYHHD
jgi:23S rRNA (pseudouridine1915-N3)-methyltransferase